MSSVGHHPDSRGLDSLAECVDRERMNPSDEGPYRTVAPSPPAAPRRSLPLGATLFAVAASLPCALGWLGPYASLFFALLGLVATFTALALGHRTRALQLGVACVLITAVACVSIVLEQRRTNALVDRYEREIIPAVYRYRADQGQYPRTLDELVPRYLPHRIPTGFEEPYNIVYFTFDDDARLLVRGYACTDSHAWHFKQHQRVAP